MHRTWIQEIPHSTVETMGRGRDRAEGLVPRGHGCSREDRDGRPLRMVQVEQRNLRKAGLLNLVRELAVSLCLSLYRSLTLKPNAELGERKLSRSIKQRQHSNS